MLALLAASPWTVGASGPVVPAGTPVNLADLVRKHPERTWEPTDDSESVFAEWPVERMRGLLGTIAETVDVTMEATSTELDEDLPESFDSRTKWPGCVHAIRKQGDCGGCWAFAASETLSDNLCVTSNGSINVTLSPQDAISCDSSDWGCNGGQPSNVWKYMSDTGLTTDECTPYVSLDGKTNGTCSSTCSSSCMHYKKYKCGHSNFYRGFDNIKKGIMLYGPAHTVMLVWQDLLQYKTGVYKHIEGNLMGPHSVKIVGWGKEKDTEFWIVQNSWGASWGMDGFWKQDMNDLGSSLGRGGGWNCGGSGTENVAVLQGSVIADPKHEEIIV